MMFSQTRRCLDRDAEKYAEKCAKNSINGKQGGRPPKNRTDNEKTERFSQKAKKADNDTDNENVPDNDTDNENPPNGETVNKTKDGKQKKFRFIPPTVDEVKAFCAENGISINAEYFTDYYTANGWTVGKTKMRDWRATVRNWNRRNNGTQTNNAPVNSGSDLDELF